MPGVNARLGAPNPGVNAMLAEPQWSGKDTPSMSDIPPDRPTICNPESPYSHEGGSSPGRPAVPTVFIFDKDAFDVIVQTALEPPGGVETTSISSRSSFVPRQLGKWTPVHVSTVSFRSAVLKTIGFAHRSTGPSAGASIAASIAASDEASTAPVGRPGGLLPQAASTISNPETCPIYVADVGAMSRIANTGAYGAATSR